MDAQFGTMDEWLNRTVGGHLVRAEYTALGMDTAALQRNLS
jgi:hypothetical protein